MLEEDKHIQQHPGEPPRRWFSDEEIDLIVWTGEVGFTGFQLCYNKQEDEHALAWNRDRGYQHFRVDMGEPGSLKNLSPMMAEDGLIDIADLVLDFNNRAQRIDPAVRQFVLEKLAEVKLEE